MPTIDLRQATEVILTLSDDNLTSGVALNITNGTYAGGGPATVEGSTLSLPTTFVTDAKIVVLLNGQEIKKGSDAVRTSSTQVTFVDDLKTNDQIKIRIY